VRKEQTVAIQNAGLRGRRAGEGTAEASHQEKRESVLCCGKSGKKEKLGWQRKKIRKTRKVKEIG